jgi:hypothetical protein
MKRIGPWPRCVSHQRRTFKQDIQAAERPFRVIRIDFDVSAAWKAETSGKNLKLSEQGGGKWILLTKI